LIVLISSTIILISYIQAHKLAAFSAVELQRQLCGEEALDWTVEHLTSTIVPGSGYTRNSDVSTLTDKLTVKHVVSLCTASCIVKQCVHKDAATTTVYGASILHL
jgi:HECT-domain (ubiquitin-transferase)